MLKSTIACNKVQNMQQLRKIPKSSLLGGDEGGFSCCTECALYLAAFQGMHNCTYLSGCVEDKRKLVECTAYTCTGVFFSKARLRLDSLEWGCSGWRGQWEGSVSRPHWFTIPANKPPMDQSSNTLEKVKIANFREAVHGIASKSGFGAFPTIARLSLLC